MVYRLFALSLFAVLAVGLSRADAAAPEFGWVAKHSDKRVFAQRANADRPAIVLEPGRFGVVLVVDIDQDGVPEFTPTSQRLPAKFVRSCWEDGVLAGFQSLKLYASSEEQAHPVVRADRLDDGNLRVTFDPDHDGAIEVDITSDFSLGGSRIDHCD